MKWLQLTPQNTYLSFWHEYREDFVEVPDDMPCPPIDWIWNHEQEKWEAPVVPPIDTDAIRRSEILSRLAAIDKLGTRATREVALAVVESTAPPVGAVERLAELETEANALRAELATI